LYKLQLVYAKNITALIFEKIAKCFACVKIAEITTLTLALGPELFLFLASNRFEDVLRGCARLPRRSSFDYRKMIKAQLGNTPISPDDFIVLDRPSD
jgi:hypothetical protein